MKSLIDANSLRITMLPSDFIVSWKTSKQHLDSVTIPLLQDYVGEKSRHEEADVS